MFFLCPVNPLLCLPLATTTVPAPVFCILGHVSTVSGEITSPAESSSKKENEFRVYVYELDGKKTPDEE